jgi:pyruvate/2-oxoglutarate dehydrogenase complex dihydrolipoamide dehydrogenase (E3) component
VTIVARHAPREAQFESDPGWLGPRFMRAFSAEGDLVRRRAVIASERKRGTIPPDVLRELRHAIRRRSIRWLETEVQSAVQHGDGVRLSTTFGSLEVDEVILATGFARERPGGDLIEELVARHGLRIAPCGYPLVDERLRWHARVFVMGPLAELELGPSARNIAGARAAAQRILAAVPARRGLARAGA